MADLRGTRVALLEGRMGSELARLVERHGGVPVLAPALDEAPVDATAPVTKLLDALRAGDVEIVIFLTGAGAKALFGAAEGLGRGEELLERLRGTVNVARGQKPVRALKERGVPVTVMADAPYTSAEVISALDGLGVEGRGVALLNYGEHAAEIAAALSASGARLLELSLYEWKMPSDTAPLEALVREAIGGGVDAIAFTSQVQLRHLLEIADRVGAREALVRALNERTLVAAVGPTCAAALRREGIEPKVVPDNPKMGPMVLALAAALGDG